MNKSEQGITLLESLIALLVMSIGLLGTAYLMVTGIKHSNGSFARTHATYIAESLAERMRANPEAVANSDYAGFDSSTIADCTAQPAPYCQHDGATVPAACTAAELATFDTYQASCGNGGSTNGNNGVKDLLPAGTLVIACNDAPCTATSTYTLRVDWNETELGDGAAVDKTKSVQMVILP